MGLNSKTTLKIIDALCEGPIEGLVKARRSVFLNETLITGTQFVDKTVQYSTKPGVRSQRTFNAGSTFQDRQTTIVNINEQIGSSYSEQLNAEGTLRKGDPDYGTGQITRTITDVEY